MDGVAGDGLTVLAAAGTAMWGLLADLSLVVPGDELVVKEILTTNRWATKAVAN
jgi:hypothetical protein